MKLLILCALVATALAVSHDGDQVWRVHATGTQKIEALRKIISVHNLDVFGHSKTYVDFMVKLEQLRMVYVDVAKANLKHEVKIQNLQTVIDQQDAKRAAQPKVYDPAQYNNWTDIEQYLTNLAASNTMVNLQSIGQTYEGREMWQVQISTDFSANREAVWIDCGIHAREWISPATCLNGIDRTLALVGNDVAVDAMLSRYDLYILPVNNPDGYAYTMAPGGDRMWRKNRNTAEGTTGNCVGVDLNRNFADPDWCTTGTSTNNCDITYCGSSAGSEMETQNTQNAILAISPKAMYSIHAYSQMWMYPFGSKADDCPDKALLDANSAVGVAALTAVEGTNYVYGSIAEVIYLASGTTVDWAYNLASVTYSYTLELRPDSNNILVGFQLPESEIPGTVEETWSGLVAAINDMI